MNNNPNTQLPQEAVEEIKLSAMAFAAGMWPGENRHDQKQREYVKDVFIAGATTYATKLHRVETYNGLLKTEAKHLNGVIDKLQQENEELRRQNDKMKEMATGWRPLLEGVLNDWNSSALKPELKNKIRKFLYGE